MKRIVGMLVFFAALVGSVFAQVTTAEVQGIAETVPKSSGLTALLQDGSIGEYKIVVRALDAAGNPVAGAVVTWTLKNNAASPSYVVGSSRGGKVFARVYKGHNLSLDGGLTNEQGEAYIIIDSKTKGDTTIEVTVDKVAAKGYDGSSMRVVWF